MNHRLPAPSYHCQGCGEDVDLCGPNSPTDEELRDELTCAVTSPPTRRGES